jgi:predicted amidohydrolase YtcJ
VEADLLFVDGIVLTQDPRAPESDALAVRGDRIVALGRDARALPARRTVDLAGRALVPGFVDAHNHFVSYGLRLLRLDLAGARSKADVLDAVEERARLTPADGWIVGHSWDEAKWSDRTLPTQEELDRAASGRRALLARVDRHGGLATTAALRAAGVDAERGPFVVEAEYERLVEATKPSPGTLVKAIGAATRRAHALGVTSSHVMCTAEDFAALQLARDQGVLGVRASCFVYEKELPHALGLGARRGLGDPWVRLLGVKLFADGSFGSRTAAVSFPYRDQEGQGLFVHEPGRLEELVRQARVAGLQVAVHAIGDRAARRVVDAFESAGVGPAERARIEHLELADDEDVKRAAAMGVVASVQPNFTGEWGHRGGMYESRLGWERARRLNRFRSYHEAGLPLAFGSDDMPLGPLYGMRSAVEAPEAEQRVTPEQALAAYTRGAAWAAFAEDEVGTLAPGMLADLVVLSRDPRSAEGMREARVEMTVVGGEVAHEAARQEQAARHELVP